MILKEDAKAVAELGALTTEPYAWSVRVTANAAGFEMDYMTYIYMSEKSCARGVEGNVMNYLEASKWAGSMMEGYIRWIDLWVGRPPPYL
jgi:hypothetical protein